MSGYVCIINYGNPQLDRSTPLSILKPKPSGAIDLMLKPITCSIFTAMIATSALADGVTLSITSATNRVKDPNVASPDRCTLTVEAHNAGSDEISFTAMVMPTVQAGSFSSYTFGILNDAPEPVFGALGAQASASEELRFTGLDCDHIASVSIEPICGVAPNTNDCGDSVTVLETTVKDVVLPNQSASAEEIDGGPLHGNWQAIAEDSSEYLTVEIVDDRSGSFTASFITTDAFCDYLAEPSGCSEGQLNKAVSVISGDEERLYMRLDMTDNPNKDQVDFLINTVAGTGSLTHTSKLKIAAVSIQQID